MHRSLRPLRSSFSPSRKRALQSHAIPACVTLHKTAGRSFKPALSTFNARRIQSSQFATTQRCNHNFASYYGQVPDDEFSFTSGRIQQIQSLQDLEEAVAEFERMPTLRKRDHELLVKPLLRLCKETFKREKIASAILGERIILHCLSRLPEDHQDRLDNISELLQPDIDDFNVVILLCGTQRSEEGAEQAERLVRLMLAEHRNELSFLGTKKEPMTPNAPAPTMLTFKFLLRAWALAGTFECAVEAGRILDSMEAMSGMKDKYSDDIAISIARPDTQCYNTLLNSYAKLSPTEDILGHAKALLERIKSTKPPDFESQLWFAYHSILKCYYKYIRTQQKPSTSEDEGDVHINDAIVVNALASDLEALLKEFENIPVPESFETKFTRESRFGQSWAYGILVQCYLLPVDCGHKQHPLNLEKAHSLVLSMAGRESATLDSPISVDPFQNWPEQNTLIALWNKWSESKETDKLERIEELRSIVLDTRVSHTQTLNVHLQRWLTSQIDETPEIVEAILMKHLSDLVPQESPTPSHPDDARPNPKTFLLAMRAWLWSSRPEAPQRVEKILDLMDDLHESTKYQRFKPIDRHYKYVLRSWLRHCESGERHVGTHGKLLAAEHISLHLRQFPMKYRPDNVVSTNIAECYETVLDAWARQEIPQEEHVMVDQLQNCLAWLDKFQEILSAKPTPPHCNAVLRCCVRWDGTKERRKRAYEVASGVYRRGRPDATTFVLVVRIVKSSLGEAIGEVHVAQMCDIVRDAKREGLLSQQLVWEIAEVAGPQELQNLFDVSKRAAERFVALRSMSLSKEKDGGEELLVWSGEKEAAKHFSVENMPRSWCHLALQHQQKD